MTRVIGDQDQIGRLRPREVADAPGIDLNDLSRMLDLHAGVNDRGDLDVATGGGKPVTCHCETGGQDGAEECQHTTHDVPHAWSPRYSRDDAVCPSIMCVSAALAYHLTLTSGLGQCCMPGHPLVCTDGRAV